MGDMITFLVGNGLGMALDHEAYDLKKGMEEAWEKLENGNNTEVMNFIKSLCEGKKPEGENDLEKVQEKIFSRIESGKNKGESDEILKGYRNYLFDIAAYFCNIKLDEENKVKVEDFIKNLFEFMRKCKESKDICNITTLNYDKLLYLGFINMSFELRCKLFDYVTDGFYPQKKKGFLTGRLQMSFMNTGFYIHLHGSPLFFTRSNLIEKTTKNDGGNAFEEVTNNDPNMVREHIVLCHADQKSKLIEHSYLLTEYLKYFDKIVKDSKKIVLFGYAGKDKHINQIIQESKAVICVVEWSGEKGERKKYWEEIFGQERCIHYPMDDILNFNFDRLKDENLPPLSGVGVPSPAQAKDNAGKDPY